VLVLKPQNVYGFWARLLDIRVEMLGPEVTDLLDEHALGAKPMYEDSTSRRERSRKSTVSSSYSSSTMEGRSNASTDELVDCLMVASTSEDDDSFHVSNVEPGESFIHEDISSPLATGFEGKMITTAAAASKPHQCEAISVQAHRGVVCAHPVSKVSNRFRRPSFLLSKRSHRIYLKESSMKIRHPMGRLIWRLIRQYYPPWIGIKSLLFPLGHMAVRTHAVVVEAMFTLINRSCDSKVAIFSIVFERKP
jgi:hypothetical protein